jgi:hypothetical protein
MSDQAVELGKAAWERLKSAKPLFTDWLAVGAALLVFRGQAMAEAKRNSPFGPKYQAAINRLLTLHDMQDIDSHERRGAIVMVENRAELEKWRATLTPIEQRRCNHPNSVLALWKKNGRPHAPGPKRNIVKPSVPHLGRAVGQPSSDDIRRIATALREARSNDFFVLAKAAWYAMMTEAAPAAPAPARGPAQSMETTNGHAHA